MLEKQELIREAQQRDMPPGKMRGILREYLQILILRELYKLPQGKSLCFTGGTYLRLVHRIKRFSEDLDFNTDEITQDTFENLMKQIQQRLKHEGLSAAIAFRHWDNILAGEFVFPDVEQQYGIFSVNQRKEGIVIKFETNRPQWGIKTESLLVSGFGNMFPVVCTERGALFADKIDALIKKNRARHLFDIMFMLSHNYSIDLNVANALGMTGPLLELILSRVASLSEDQLQQFAEQLRPFLFEESEADLIAHAKTIILQLIENYQRR